MEVWTPCTGSGKVSLGRLKIFLPKYRVWEGFTLKTVDMCPRYRVWEVGYTGHCGHVTPSAGSRGGVPQRLYM